MISESEILPQNPLFFFFEPFAQRIFLIKRSGIIESLSIPFNFKSTVWVFPMNYYWRKTVKNSFGVKKMYWKSFYGETEFRSYSKSKRDQLCAAKRILKCLNWNIKLKVHFFMAFIITLKKKIQKSSKFFEIFATKHFRRTRGLFCEVFNETVTDRNKRALHMAEKSHQGYFPKKILTTFKRLLFSLFFIA